LLDLLSLLPLRAAARDLHSGSGLENHFVRISKAASHSSLPVAAFEDSTTLLSKPSEQPGSGNESLVGRFSIVPQSKP
jgi:hypothetical protein